MPRRYLFGPVTGNFADQSLHRARQAGECLTFGTTAGVDLPLQPGDSWEALSDRLPASWRPEFVALYLPYTIVPRFLWSAPVPVVALAADWNLLWHAYRNQLAGCDLVLTDTAGVEAFQRQGITHARAAILFGLEGAYLEHPWPDGPRAIDVLLVGNLNPAVQAERLPWLARLARLGERWQVAICTGVFGADYRQLLGQARIVFNRSIRGECNKRVFEAAAAGALLLQEAGNRELSAYFRDRQECVLYTDDNLEELLTYYLENEDERRAIAEAARAKVAQFGFEALWQETVTGPIEREWDGMVERAGQRQAWKASLSSRLWQAVSSADGDPALTADVAAALVERPSSATLHNALGLLAGRGKQPQALQAALGSFQRALAQQPDHPLAALNAAECLVMLNQTQPAIDMARNALAALDRTSRLDREMLDCPHFPVAFDSFRVEWERAAWAYAGQPAAEGREKRRLLRWRLHLLLAELTGELHHYYEATLARPDLPVTQAMLGCALARAGQVPQAIPHLRDAVAANPFDRNAARLLFQALGEAKDVAGQRRLARDRRLLAQAAASVVPAEGWFTEAPPVGDELASILILCCNELEYTRRCLESVLRHTRAPYELVIVDNGSTDGTPAFLEEFRQRSGPARVAVIRNDSNKGFAAGCNQALAQARGEYIVFLNNDTVVTPGWLDGLITWSLSDWPNVGLVGAVTNYSRPPQQIDVDYTDLTGMLPFAARRKQEFAGKALVVERLTGFCLLARRDVLAKLGGLDEGYGIGFFEDDDLSVRAREAGLKLLVALDVFIHHFGSRTFSGLGVNCQEQLRENFERFRDKWGVKHAAGYRVPEAAKPAAPPPTPSRPVLAWPEEQVADTVARALAATPTAIATVATGKAKVSLCMIVRNEEANLGDCLGSVADLVDEVVVIDTGSTDTTKEIAQRFGARVHDFPWVDSFAAARNESLKYATGDWTFWMDADDRLDEANRQKLRVLLGSLADENIAYVMKCVCLPDPISKTVTVVDHLRLFRNHPEIRWQYRVHEQILPAIRRRKGEVRWSDVVVHHVGYQDPALRRRKLERDIRLLQLEDQEHPDDPFTLFNLGQVFQELGKPAEAIPVLRRSLERSQPGDSIVRKLYALIAGCHRQLGQWSEAQAACQEGRRYYPDDAELLFQEGLVRREQKDLVGAEECLLKLLTSREGDHFASIDAGLRGHKARHNLAILYQEQGRVAEAEAQWMAAVDEAPGFAPAWFGLAEMDLAQGRWAELNAVVGKLSEAGQVMEAGVIQARGHLARKDFGNARRILEETIGRFPEAVWPRRILSHVLLQEGSDPAAAEQALQALLALSPNDREATNNLAVLRAKQPGESATPLAPEGDGQSGDGQSDSLRAPAEQSLATARQKGEPHELATALADLGTACLHEGDSHRAVSLLQEALDLVRQLGQPERDVLDNLGMALATLGQLSEAKPLLEQSLAQARAAQDRFLERFILEHLGQVLLSAGDPASALAHVEEGLVLAKDLGLLHEETAMLWFTAILHAELGQRDQALARGQAAIQLMEKIGKPQAQWYAEHLRRYHSADGEARLNVPGAPGVLVAGAWPSGEAAEPQGPSLLRQAVTATKAMAAFVGSGFKTVSAGARQERLQLCAACEHHTGLRCRLCGCFTSAKTRLPYERCPLGKWPS